MKAKNQAKSAHFRLSSLTRVLVGGAGLTDGQKVKKLLDQKQSKQKSRKSQKTSKSGSIINSFLKSVLNLLIVLSFGGLLFWQGPKILYTIFPQGNNNQIVQAEELKGDFNLDFSVLDEEATKRRVLPSQRSYKPAYNPDLPDGDWLVIPRIGVRSELQRTENYEEALNVGLWWVPDFGQAGDRSKPMIVAGHRYGFDWWWKDDYWKYHSFYSLPDLEPGDRIEVISEHRKWIYEVYAGEEGEQISDYEADLILYTCKHLDSPIRIFRYARIVEVKEDSALGILNK